jgi:endonuclease/exonuclease/phosphatase family metal-dependent hydrolase
MLGCLGLAFGLGCETGEDLEDGLEDDFSDRATSVGLYQAESYTAQSGCSKATNKAGYTGSAFVDYGSNGTWIELNNVAAAQAGSHTLKFRYATADGSRQCAVIINGTNVGNVAFSSTGSWTNWGTATITSSLRAGNNTIRIQANTSSGGPNLDSMEVLSNVVASGPCVEAAENKTATLSCPSGQTIVSVKFASYGLPTGACPGGFVNGSCHAASSMDKVKAACLNKGSCSVVASNSVFGDPCAGKAKKLAVVYTCGAATVDNCPNDPNKTQPGACGCGVPEGTCGAVTLDRNSGSELRIASYNVMRSSVFPLDNGNPGKTGTAARIEGFKRIADAINADIWAMQELMYDGNDQPGRTPAGLKKYMEKLTGRTLYMAHHTNYQEFVFSRYPIDASGSVGHRTVWTLIDVGNDDNRQNDVAVISVHFVSDSGGTDAANLVKSILAGNHTIPKDVTLVVAGDFNNDPNGPRYAAVRSAMGIADVRPIWLGTKDTRFTHGSLTYTNGAFKVPSGGNPIDYVFARTNSRYAVAKNTILGTLVLSQSVLDAHDLERMDSALDPGQSVSEGTSVNCDHLPLVVDLRQIP